jgi:hypothetical protein
MNTGMWALVGIFIIVAALGYAFYRIDRDYRDGI